MAVETVGLAAGGQRSAALVNVGANLGASLVAASVGLAVVAGLA